MARLSDTQRNFLREATTAYRQSLPESPAAEHLVSRGLLGTSDRMDEALMKFRLGYVADPLPGHDMYRGMLAIPYLRKDADANWSVVSMRFRCVVPDCTHEYHGKYNTVEGDRPRLYNTTALLQDSPKMLVCEGEMDAIAATVYGFHAVAVPGVQTWQKHFVEPLLGYETVYVVADGDKPGMDFAKRVNTYLPNGRIIPAPDGEDLNSWITTPDGYNEFKERISR